MLCWCSILCWRFDWCIPQLAMIKLNDYKIDWKLVFKKDPRGRRLAQWRNVELTKGLMQKEMKLSEVNVIEKSEFYCFKVRKKIDAVLSTLSSRSPNLGFGRSTTAGQPGVLSCWECKEATKCCWCKNWNCVLVKQMTFFLVPAQTRKRRRSKSRNTCCPRWSFNTNFVNNHKNLMINI